MHFSQKKINQYCEQHTSPPSNVLYELNRATHLQTLAPQMASGHVQGQFFTFLSQMIRPKTILEIGTFTGYSAICLAQGLEENGVLHTIEANEEFEYIIQDFVKKAELQDKIKLHIGDAKSVIPTLDLEFDLVFLDAAKREYAIYYDLFFEKIKIGGYLLVDNVLWDGKVVHQKKDTDTRILDDFNKKIQADPRVENVLLPIRDGIMLVKKIAH
ncbi:MAG TPA: methyltransferase [Phaeodactylibacter sp.]|nr:methyltransferase [Phaeodactylibacter sp.]